MARPKPKATFTRPCKLTIGGMGPDGYNFEIFLTAAAPGTFGPLVNAILEALVPFWSEGSVPEVLVNGQPHQPDGKGGLEPIRE